MEYVVQILVVFSLVAGGASSDVIAEESLSEVALFQGHCSSPSSPCHQICIAKSSMTYECGCREGFELSQQDGYTCLEITTKVAEVQPSSSWQQQVLGNNSGCLTFVSPSWFSLPPLSNAYEEDYFELEFNPSNYGGILLLSGERMTDFKGGDYIVLLISSDGHVEFRFDCGSGPALIKTPNKSVLNDWNQVRATRQRWDGSLTLNGVTVTGKSAGLFSRITFRERVYIGGVPTTTTGLSSWQPQQDLLPSFSGSLRRLRINNMEYSLKKSADYEFGGGVQECGSHGDCTCLHGGQCSPGNRVCDCPLGYKGESCEVVLQMKTPSFNGSSHLLFKPLAELLNSNIAGSHGNETTTNIESYLELKIVFKPTAHDGVILYSTSNVTDEDYIYIYIDGGHVVFELDLGSGAGRGRSMHPLLMDKYHTLLISRTGRLVTMNTDQQPTITMTTPGGYTQLSLGEVYLGGLGVIDGGEKLGVRTGFSGCVQELTINSIIISPLISHASLGLNIGDCSDSCDADPCLHGNCLPRLDDYTCQCQSGWSGFDCSQVIDNVGGVYRWTGESWANSEVVVGPLNLPPTTLNLTLQLRTSHTQGLLLLWGRVGSDYIAIGLENGYLSSWINLGGGEVHILYNTNTTRLDDGEWRTVAIGRLEQHLSISVDGGPVLGARIPGKMADFSPAGRIWIGGHHNIPLATSSKYAVGFSGCLRDVTLNTVKLELSVSSGLEYC